MQDIPSLSNRPVGSRFVSQDEIESAKARREEQWKAAYARLGQEPPPPQQEDSYDGRSLAEKLAANRIAKQEEWEEKTKLANQFRALEEDEIMFLDSMREKQEAEERERRQRDGEEVKNFKEAVAARTQASNPPPTTTTSSKAPPSKPVVTKKDKKPLKGVVVKRKAKPSNQPEAESKPENKDKKDAKAEPQGKIEESSQDDEPASKRRRISDR